MISNFFFFRKGGSRGTGGLYERCLPGDERPGKEWTGFQRLSSQNWVVSIQACQLTYISRFIILKLWIYEIHIFELRNEELNVKKILAVINATYAVAKRKPEKISLAGIRTLRVAKSCVNNCEDLLYIYFFNPQFKYMNFIYS